MDKTSQETSKLKAPVAKRKAIKKNKLSSFLKYRLRSKGIDSKEPQQIYELSRKRLLNSPGRFPLKSAIQRRQPIHLLSVSRIYGEPSHHNLRSPLLPQVLFRKFIVLQSLFNLQNSLHLVLASLHARYRDDSEEFY